MRRDPNLTREILIALEAKPDTTSLLHPRELAPWDSETISYELRALHEAGLIVARWRECPGSPLFCLGERLTHSGHALLDKIRSESQWQRIRAHLRERGAEVTVETLGAAASVVLEQMLRGGR